MSVIIVSKKAHSAFKFLTIIFAFIAIVSLGLNIKMLVDVNTYKNAYHTVAEKLTVTNDELQDTKKEKDDLAKTVEKRKIAMIAASKETECLATNIYFEAGAESKEGKLAVAAVVANRMAHPSFPKTASGEVYQGSARETGCQFSWTCDKMSKAIQFGSAAWEESKQIAFDVLSGRKKDVTRGALYFHNGCVMPRWASKERFTIQIGGQKFYK